LSKRLEVSRRYEVEVKMREGEVTDVLPADEKLFILAPIHVQLSYDKLVIPGDNAAQIGTTES